MPNFGGERSIFMSPEQRIVYHDNLYNIIGVEQEFVVHPSVFGLLPLHKAAMQQPFTSQLHVEDYKLILDKLELVNDETLSACSCEEEKEILSTDVSYQGTILIGTNLVQEYYIGNKLACFSYQKVYELVFKNGLLITTIDQSKAMLKIRKNIDAGLRNLSKSRDIRCIKKFLNSSLVGDYKSFLFAGRRLKYVKNMQEDYQ